MNENGNCYTRMGRNGNQKMLCSVQPVNVVTDVTDVRGWGRFEFDHCSYKRVLFSKLYIDDENFKNTDGDSI